MPTPGAMHLDQAGRLQGLLQEVVRHGDPMLAPHDLMKVPHIEPHIPLAIQTQS
jgi:hypothetical protein